MQSIKLYNQERVALREELHHLKNCQVTFLTSSVAATGVLLGIATTLSSKEPIGFFFLFPLVVLIPSWWIFFDKATTITRIVGYCRILEGLILGYYYADNFIGWENALREFRKRQATVKCNRANGPPKAWRSVLAEILLLRTGFRYWIFSYWTFLTLSGLCVVVSAVPLNSTWFVVGPMPVILFLISVVWNARVLWHLIGGRYSYDHNERVWKKILHVYRTRP